MDAWPEPPPVPSWPTTGASPPLRPEGALAPELVAMVAGRAQGAPGFWPFLTALGALLALWPGILIVVGLVDAPGDQSATAQVVWGAVLLVSLGAALGAVARRGTSVGNEGMTRGRRTWRWEEVGGFRAGGALQPGLWMVPAGGGEAVLVPSALHQPSHAQAQQQADRLNQALGRPRPVAPDDGTGRSELERWASRAWIWSVLLFGVLTPFTLARGAARAPRRVLWLLAAAAGDLVVAYWVLALPQRQTHLQAAAGATALLIVWPGATAALMVLWLVLRRRRRHAQPGPPGGWPSPS